MPDLFPLSSAAISPCGKYRYALTRGEPYLPMLHWIMLNPSTADASRDDPTIRKCLGFARRLGYHAISVHNLFAVRATDRRDMMAASDPVGPDNHTHILKMLERAHHEREPVICAWGAHGGYMDQDEAVMGWIDAEGLTPICLGRCKSGHPRHPLMLAYTVAPERYYGRFANA